MSVVSPPRPAEPATPAADELAALREQALIEEARTRARQRRRRIAVFAVTAGCVVLGAAVGLALAERGGSSAATDSPAAAAVPHPNAPGLIAVTGGTNLDLVAANGSSTRRIASCPTSTMCVLSAPTWSPDGRRVAFLRGHPGGNVTPARLSLFVIDADGSDETRVADCLPAPRNDGDCGWATRSGLSWSPDSTRIVFTRGGALVVYDARTGAVRPLTRCDGESCADRSPRWSPDGSEIAFARADGIAAIRPDGTGLRTIVAVAAGALAWSPDGTRLAFDDLDGISTIRADGSRQRRLIAWKTPGEGPGMPAWSPDGHRIAYFATPRGSAAFVPEVWVMDADGGTRTRLFHGACCVGLWAAPVWSPDGRWLAFAATSDKDGVVSGGTFVVAADGSGLAPIADRPVPAEQLAWQPSR